jgi:putative PIG3 family NAD(P)H quinone oxidoreductase
MRAVQAPEPGGPEALKILDLPDPVPGEGEVVVDVVASGLNRADIMQRMGHYPPPPGASDVLGLECSGVVAAIGAGVDTCKVGDRVCALLSAGGYATKVSVPAGQLLPVPDAIDLVHAAALPEVVCTVWSNVFMLAALQPGENFLVHGGGSGIGTMAIQLAKAVGARVLTTAGSADKLAALRRLGADAAIDYRDEDFVEVVRAETADHGADVILDNMGAKYLERNVRTLATAGRLVIIGLQGGTKAELDLNALLRKRAAVMASSLRARSAAEKAAIVASVRENVWPLIADGVVKPIVHTALPLDQVAEAHRLMEDGGHIGKIMLTV